MGRFIRSRKVVCTAVAFVLLVAAAGRSAVLGAEAWTPLSGQVDPDAARRDTADARFKHACALIATGQHKSGISMLRSLIAERPSAEFAGRARYMIGLALFSSGRYGDAFDELAGFLDLHPDGELAKEARELQLRAALETGKEDVDDALALLDRLIERATSDEFAARCRKEKADLMLEAERYLFAKDEYRALVDEFPRSEWVPYCFRKMAECDLRLGLWLARGDEYIKRARKLLSDFVRAYPGYDQMEEVEDELAQVRALEARENKRIALFYIRWERRPAAAVNYLRYIVEEFPLTAEARWAEKTLDGIRQSRKTPLTGRLKPVPLPGLTEAAVRPETEKD